MILGAHQLHYLPWLRYFHKIAGCDIFVILDNIQFNKNGWQNRNQIKTPQGAHILTVPVLHQMGQSLSEVAIDNKNPWRRKHWGSLSNHYSKAPFFKEHESFFEQVYETEWFKLNDLNYKILDYLLKTLGIKTKIIRSSDLNIKGEASERLVEICKQLGAASYFTGSYAAQTYLENDVFQRAGIELKFQTFECPKYPQLYSGTDFIPELSIVDLLFNCGPKSLEILMASPMPFPHDFDKKV